MMIDTDKYFMEMTDKGGGTIGYYVTNPSRLLLEIHKQNKQLILKTQECEELKKTIKTIFKALIIANHKDIGTIQDTIWVDKITTLWDYIMITLDMNDDQFKEFEKQAIRKMERIYE